MVAVDLGPTAAAHSSEPSTPIRSSDSELDADSERRFGAGDSGFDAEPAPLSQRRARRLLGIQRQRRAVLVRPRTRISGSGSAQNDAAPAHRRADNTSRRTEKMTPWCTTTQRITACVIHNIVIHNKGHQPWTPSRAPSRRRRARSR